MSLMLSETVRGIWKNKLNNSCSLDILKCPDDVVKFRNYLRSMQLLQTNPFESGVPRNMIIPSNVVESTSGCG